MANQGLNVLSELLVPAKFVKHMMIFDRSYFRFRLEAKQKYKTI